MVKQKVYDVMTMESPDLLKPNNLEVKRKSDGTFAKGTPPPNPAGRPPGKTLKEFARELLMSMNDEEKRKYLAELPKEIVWRMSEGNPHNTQDVTSAGERIEIPILANAIPSNPSNQENPGT